MDSDHGVVYSILFLLGSLFSLAIYDIGVSGADVANVFIAIATFASGVVAVWAIMYD